MSSILKVDTIQDQAGNNIINENSNTITIGASGDTINIIGTLQNNGGALPGDISSVVAGTGLTGGGTSGAVTINIEAAQPTITSLGTITSFRSTGIDDNSNALAMTIDSSERIGIGTTSPSTTLDVAPSGSDLIGLNIRGRSSDNKSRIEFRTNDNSAVQFQIESAPSSASYIKVVPNQPLIFRTNNSDKMTITGAGLVGIGTSNPSHNLTVDGGTSTSVSLIKDETGSATVRYYNGGSQKAYIQLTSSEDMDFYASSGVDQVFYGQGVERMRLNGGAVFNEGSVDADFRVESNGNANMLYVDGGNNRVGIGTSNPSTNLEITTTASDNGILLKSTGNTGNALDFDANRTGALNGIGTLRAKWNGNGVSAIYLNAGSDTTNKDDGIITFNTRSSGTGVNPPERMRIDSSGNLLVGKTSSSSSSVGVEFRPAGLGIFGRDGNTALTANRLNSDGTIISVRKDNSIVGSIGANGDNLVIDCPTSAHTGLDFANDKLIPRRNSAASNNTVDLGYSGGRFKDIYLGGGAFLGGTGTANKLDDYEEGTWTPTWTGANASDATYTKIGRVVYASGKFHATGSGTSGHCGGLPFSSAIDGADGGGSGYHNQDTVTWSVLKIDSTGFRFYTGSTQKQLTGSSQARFFITYQV